MPPDNRKVAVRVEQNPRPWISRHQNCVVRDYQRFYEIETPRPRDTPFIPMDLKLSASALNDLVRAAVNERQRIR
jgi:hypothetical protein